MVSRITRRKFIETSSLTALAAALPSFAFSQLEIKESLAIGLCGGWENSELAKFAGCSYIEEATGKFLMPEKSDDEFEKQKQLRSTAKSLPVECCNVFLPRELKSVGNEANHERIIKYASVAFNRAEQTDVKIIVFGSSGSRTIPEGFDRAKAKEQFISLCQSLAPIARKHKILLAIENLNKSETNFINSLKEAAEIVETVRHPNLKMMCDIYHALRENDPASELVRYQDHLIHCHIAEKEERTPPGRKGDDFTPYLDALKKINYSGRLSIECKWTDMQNELPLAVKTITEQNARL